MTTATIWNGQAAPDPGDFQLVKMGGTSGKLIHLGEIANGDGFVDYEHARIYVGDGKFVEAQPGGAVLAAHNINEGLWSTGLFGVTPSERRVLVSSARHYADIKVGYSAADYFAIAALRLHLGLVTPGLNWYVENSKHMICSQLVDQCYKDAGIQLFNDKRKPGDVTPAALADLVIAKRLQRL